MIGRWSVRLRALSTSARIRLLTALLLLCALVVDWFGLRGLAPPTAGYHLSSWTLLPAFFLGEVALVHVQFRRDNHSFSMTDVPLALGMLFAVPGAVLLTALLASTLALGVYRRLSPLKLAFNVATVASSVSIGLLVFRTLLPTYEILTVHVWIVTVVAILVTGLIAGSTVMVAISLSEGSFQPDRLPILILMTLAGVVTNTSLALIAASLLMLSADTVWLLLVPAGTVFVAYRAYLSEREKHESLEFLYHATRILTETPELEQAVVALVARAREMFRAESAEMLFATPDRKDMMRTRVADGIEPQLMENVADRSVRALWDRLSARPETLLVKYPTGDAVVDAYLHSQNMDDAMIAPLHGESRPFGLVVVGNRIGAATFDAEDARLFETLANHTSVALENGRLEQSLSQLRELEQRLKHLAFHDPLTGLANRSLFSERADAAMARLGAEGHDCAVLFIDLDDFKTINDTLGHATGDALLCAVAERILGCLRPGDVAARLGGDEFAILLHDVAAPMAAQRVAERVTDALRLPVAFASQDVLVRASIGIAHGEGLASADELLGNADLAMYMAKSEGKGSFRTFTPTMRADAATRHQLKADLERAVHRGEFVVYYQPILDLETELPVAFEALVRWQHPEHGLLLPDTFIPMAEETGLIASIGHLVLKEAARQGARWQEEFPLEVPIRVTVNLSPLQVRLPLLVVEVQDVMARTNLAPGSLVLEITESLMLQDADASVQVLHSLRALGVRLALDDFGTGYSSLGHLRRLPIDMLKIAKTFVDDLEGHGDNSAFANAILALGRTLNLITVAEGVEHPWQVVELRRLGCALGQGFHFARPMTADDARTYLRQHLPATGEKELARVIQFPA
ncbi:MAG: EAL domain-containing protein [Mycobacteriales bacterium]